jgi:hypothetical protein
MAGKRNEFLAAVTVPDSDRAVIIIITTADNLSPIGRDGYRSNGSTVAPKRLLRRFALVTSRRKKSAPRFGAIRAPYLWPVQAFADWAESHSAPGLTRCG